jgi:hypothetical protein
MAIVFVICYQFLKVISSNTTENWVTLLSVCLSVSLCMSVSLYMTVSLCMAVALSVALTYLFALIQWKLLYVITDNVIIRLMWSNLRCLSGPQITLWNYLHLLFVIIRLKWSVMAGPKVITLSSIYCNNAILIPC